jgi:hypothetical protein
MCFLKLLLLDLGVRLTPEIRRKDWRKKKWVTKHSWELNSEIREPEEGRHLFTD